MSLIDNSTRSGLSIRKCPKRGLTLLRAGLDTWLISPRIYPKNSNLMDKMSCSKIRRDKKVSEATNDPMRPSRTPPIKRLAPKSRYVEPMNLDFLKYYDMICIFALYDLFLFCLSVATSFCFHASFLICIIASLIQKKKILSIDMGKDINTNKAYHAWHTHHFHGIKRRFLFYLQSKEPLGRIT